MADTTPTLREAAQQAMEALAPLANATTPAEREALTDADAQAADAASCDLRAAMAEQAAEQAEPGSWRSVGSDDGMRHPEACDLVGGETDMTAEQAEPVAWMDTATLDVIHAERKRAWSENYGQGGKTKAATYTVPLHAAPPAPARQEWQPLTQSHVDYVLQYGGRCRDCADENGVCPGSGLPCRGEEKAVWYVLRALNYGFKHGYITAAPAEGGAA